jgi:hypothetical protein
MELYINPLSVNGQCRSLLDVEHLIRALHQNIFFCRHLINAGNLEIFYDNHIELRKIYSDELFAKTLGALSKDARDLWYISIRNRTKNLVMSSENDSIEVSVNNKINGMIHTSLFENSKKWLSFQCAFFLHGNVSVHSYGVHKIIFNISDVEHLKSIVPMYQASPKHGRDPYISASGEQVSPMPKSDAEAQELLFGSKLISSHPDRWAFCKASQEYYRFKRTQDEIYHGFLSPFNEVPEQIKQLFR